MPRDGPKNGDVPRLYSASAERYKLVCSNLGNSIGNVTALAEAIAGSDSYNGDKTKDLPALQACVEQLARLEEESKSRGSVCSSLRQSLVRELNNNESAINEVEEYKRQIETAEQRWKPETVDAVERKIQVKKLRELVQTARAGHDDDDVVVQMTSDGAQTTCPLTMGPLEKPVLNRECGHVYSTAGIIGLLCQGNILGAVPTSLEEVNPTYIKRCPRVGCSNEVSAGVLERDFRTEASQRHAQRRAVTQQEDQDDDVEVL